MPNNESLFFMLFLTIVTIPMFLIICKIDAVDEYIGCLIIFSVVYGLIMVIRNMFGK